jgi:hypothetical protein
MPTGFFLRRVRWATLGAILVGGVVSMSSTVSGEGAPFSISGNGPSEKRDDVAELKAQYHCLTKDWEKREVGGYIVENNVWNKGDRSDYSQCVFLEPEASGAVRAGWAWKWNNPTNDVVAYPDIIFGKNPWFETSTTTTLPARIREAGDVEILLDVEHTGTGKRNLAFQVWLTNASAATPKSVTREVMIWLENNGLRPAGTKIADLSLDGKALELWENPRHGDPNGLEWNYFAFVYKTPLLQGQVPLSKMLEYLVETGRVAPDEYLAGINLGNEIINGSGQTLLKRYRVLLKKNGTT